MANLVADNRDTATKVHVAENIPITFFIRETRIALVEELICVKSTKIFFKSLIIPLSGDKLLVIFEHTR